MVLAMSFAERVLDNAIYEIDYNMRKDDYKKSWVGEYFELEPF